MSVRALAIAAMAAVLLLTGCTGINDRTVDAPPAAPAQIHDRWPGCLKVGAFRTYFAAPDVPTGSVPTDFTPAAAVWCSSTDMDATPPPTAHGLERRATEINPLLDYLRRPSQSAAPGSDGVCPAMAQIGPWLFLLDATGRWIAPALPTDACGFFLDSFNGTGSVWARLPYTDKVVCTVHNNDENWSCR